LACFALGAGLEEGDNGRLSESIYKNLSWRSIGPAIMGGRIDDFAVVEGQSHIIYAAAATGGLWKTTNNGTTWEPIFDNERVSSIGDVAVAPSDPNIVWVGTGEPNNRQSSSWGYGVYKSLDGGKNWMPMGLKDTHHIGRIVIDPHDANVVYIAALGHLWGPNKERGLYKTTDGGKTWTNTKFISEDTGFIDLAMDPESSQTLYAVAYQRRRTAFGFNGGGPHSGLYKTTDGGANWTRLTEGLPEGDTGRIGIDVYRRNPNVVYAIIENSKGGIFRSEDKGATWKKMSDTNPRPMYYSQIRIDPNNDQRLWVLSAAMYVSDDGGRTFHTDVVTRIHGDYHAMWIDPANSNHMIAGSDGGIHFSYDRGKSWDYVNTLPLGQFYEIGVDMRKPYYIHGGLQDNGSWAGPSATLYSAGITNEDWFRIGGGDGFYAQVDPTDHTIVYTESQDGNVARLELKTGERRNIRPEPKDGDKPYRFDWNSPIVISSHDNRTIYFGGNRLFKSTDRGDTWTESPDLTTQPERDKMPIMGVVPDKNTLSRHDGIRTYGQIVTIAESTIKEGVLYAGTDDGQLQVSRDGGKTWKNVVDRVPGLPKNTYVSRIVASRFAEGTAYATFDGHRRDDYRPYVYATTDFGETWKSINNNLPNGYTVHVLREHPRNANLLFVGTEFGAFISLDRGGRWLPLKNNLPTVPVYDIAIHPRDNDLIFATHGRSLWVLDDMTPLEHLSERVAASDLHLFDLRPAIAYRLYNHKGSTGHKMFVAPNPPYGAIINYYLKSASKDDVKVTVLDAAGKTIRDLTGSKEPGINRVVWDLRLAPPVSGAAETGEGAPPGASASPAPAPPERRRAGAAAPAASATPAPASAGPRAGFGFFGTPRGPLVLPGEYTIKVSAGPHQVTKTVRVEEDPRIQISSADRRAHYEALLALSKLLGSAEAARKSADNLKTQLTQWSETMKKLPRVPESVTTASEAVSKQLERIQRQLAVGRGSSSDEETTPDAPPSVRSRIGRLWFALESYTAPPTARQSEQIQEATKQLQGVVEQLNNLIDVEIPKLNQQMKDNNVPYLNPGERLKMKDEG
jgi:photosystem II stability/assembly factor-like uncharacterized protein